MPDDLQCVHVCACVFLNESWPSPTNNLSHHCGKTKQNSAVVQHTKSICQNCVWQGVFKDTFAKLSPWCHQSSGAIIIILFFKTSKYHAKLLWVLQLQLEKHGLEVDTLVAGQWH